MATFWVLNSHMDCDLYIGEVTNWTFPSLQDCPLDATLVERGNEYKTNIINQMVIEISGKAGTLQSPL